MTKGKPGWGERNANPNVSTVDDGAHVILHGNLPTVGVPAPSCPPPPPFYRRKKSNQLAPGQQSAGGLWGCFEGASKGLLWGFGANANGLAAACSLQLLKRHAVAFA